MSHLPCQTGHTFPDEHRTGCAYYKQQNTKRSCPKLQGTECRSTHTRPAGENGDHLTPSAQRVTHDRRHCHDALVRGGRILDGLDHQWQHIRHIGLEAAAAHDCQLANGGQHGACHPHFCACAGRVVDTRRCKRWGVQLCWCCIWLPAGRRWPARCAPPPLLCLHRQGWWTQGSVGDGLFSSAGVGASYHGRWRPAWCAPPTLLKQGRRSQKAGDVLLSSGGGRYYQLTAASMGQRCGGVWKKLRKQPVVKVCTVQSCKRDAIGLPQKTPPATTRMLGGTTGTALQQCLEEA
eukprot:scaffold18632_cov34-Tisochrysis_lutea.AAC.10